MTSAARRDLACRLQQHVMHLAGTIGERNVYHPRALHAAAAYITRCWEEQGYAVVPQAYAVEGVRSANLAITLSGSRPSAGLLLVGAHYDSVVGSPGADDNASGVATLLELSRLLRDRSLGMSLRFVAFVNEEPPFFLTAEQGSRVYAKAARKRGEDIRLMISLEMLGSYCDEPGCQRYPPLFRYFYPAQGDYIAFVGNWRSRRLLRRFGRAFARHSDFPFAQVTTFAWVPGVAWSDHLSFWIHRYRAFMITDTAFYRYACYHQPCDTPEKLDYRRMARLAEGLAEALADLAEAGI